MHSASVKKRVSRIGALVSIFLLLASFGLHAVQIPHSHANEQSHEQSSDRNSSVFVSLSEYMHGAENKFFILIESSLTVCTETLAILYGTFILYLTILSLLYVLILRRNTFQRLRIETHIRSFFAQGILNPKLY